MRFKFSLLLPLCALTVNSSHLFSADGKLGVYLLERNGQVIIQDVISNSGAELVGIRPGDILLKVGTTSIGSIQDAMDAKATAPNNTDIPMLFQTPGGLWPLNARFEKGTPYGKYKAAQPRPQGARLRPGVLPRPGNPTRPGNPPRP